MVLHCAALPKNGRSELMDNRPLTWNRPAPARRRESSNTPFLLLHKCPNCQICDQNRTRRPRDHGTTGPRDHENTSCVGAQALAAASHEIPRTKARSDRYRECLQAKTPRIPSQMTPIHRAVALVLTKWLKSPFGNLLVRSTNILSINAIRVIRVIRGQSTASFRLKSALLGGRPSCGFGSCGPWSCGPSKKQAT